jgi:hypothetical protein
MSTTVQASSHTSIASGATTAAEAERTAAAVQEKLSHGRGNKNDRSRGMPATETAVWSNWRFAFSEMSREERDVRAVTTRGMKWMRLHRRSSVSRRDNEHIMDGRS